MGFQIPECTCEVEQGIHVVTFCKDSLTDPVQIKRIKDYLYQLLDGGVERLILDFKDVPNFGSEILGVLIVVRRKLATRAPFKPPRSRKWEWFEICPDRKTALAAMATVDSDPLVLCSIKPPLQEIFRVC